MNNLNLTHRQELIGLFSDTHKDAYGYRPKGIDFNTYTDEELEAKIENFSNIAAEAAAEDSREEELNAEKFKAMLERYITEFGAADENEAIKWYLQSSDINIYNSQDIEQIVWNEGFLFTDYGKALVEKMINVTQENPELISE